MIRVFQMKMLDKGAEGYDEWLNAFRLTTAFGSKLFEDYMLDLYDYKASLNTTDLENAFQIMNRWSDEDKKLIDWIDKGATKSMSVGDILELEVDANVRTYMVDGYGFTEIREAMINGFAV